MGFHPQTEDFHYTAEDLMDFYGDKPISALIVINPDNPSGNYIPYDGLIKLIDWAKEKGISIVIDESFVDFSREAGEKDIAAVTMIDDVKKNLLIKDLTTKINNGKQYIGLAVRDDDDNDRLIEALLS